MISNKNNNKNPTLLYDSTVAPETTISEDFWGNIGGGLRNYLSLLNASDNQFLRDPTQPASATIDGKPNSVLQVMFYGTPANNADIIEEATRTGAKLLNINNNPGDTVGLVFGGNGSVFDAALGTYSSWKLFGDKSPHSNYQCRGIACSNDIYRVNIANPASVPNINFNTNLNFNQNLNFPLATFPKLNSGSQ